MRSSPAAPVTAFTIRPNSACNDGSWRWLTDVERGELAAAMRRAVRGRS